ncbi:unannotated protein [freshwater metagenome]|uniref:Unannotated protein n=1 Tax=freshwater metagenome TaxID=449393 RepID=A0A6J6XL51_9ZZZZ
MAAAACARAFAIISAREPGAALPAAFARGTLSAEGFLAPAVSLAAALAGAAEGVADTGAAAEAAAAADADADAAEGTRAARGLRRRPRVRALMRMVVPITV